MLGATQPRKDVEMGLGTEGAQSGLGECTQDKMAKLFDGGSCSTRQIGAAVNSDELGFAGCTPVRRDAVMRVHREFAIVAE